MWVTPFQRKPCACAVAQIPAKFQNECVNKEWLLETFPNERLLWDGVESSQIIEDVTKFKITFRIELFLHICEYFECLFILYFQWLSCLYLNYNSKHCTSRWFIRDSKPRPSLTAEIASCIIHQDVAINWDSTASWLIGDLIGICRGGKNYKTNIWLCQIRFFRVLTPRVVFELCCILGTPG